MTANVSPQEQTVLPLADKRNRYGLLARLSVPQKLVLAGSIFALPVAVLGILNFSSLYRSIAQVREAKLAVPIGTQGNLFNFRSGQLLAEAITARRGGVPLSPATLQAADQSFSAYVAAAEAVPDFASRTVLDRFKRSWGIFKDALNNPDIDPVELTGAYRTLLSVNLVQPLGSVPVITNLPAASVAVPSELQEAMFRAVPSQDLLLTNAYEQARIAVFNKESDKGSYLALVDRVRSDLDNFNSGVGTVMESKAVSPEVSDRYAKYLESAYAYTDAMEDELLGRGGSLESARQNYVKAAEALTQQGLGLVGTILDREQQAKNTSLVTQLILATVLLALGAWLLWQIVGLISRSLLTLTESARKLSSGNYATQVPITTADEFAVLGRSFNGASHQLRQNQLRIEKERQSAQELQQNIGEFLNVTMDIAEGDLTKRGKVTEDILGNVVDSINLMADELAGTLKQVQQASQSVTDGSQQMLGATEQMGKSSRTAAEQAQLLANRAQEINRRIQDMALSAQQSAEAARQARETSEQGQEALQTTLQGMNLIREGTRNVTVSMQSLAQRSRQIEEVVETITQISSQINLLSLHASIEAAGAGEAGSRFSVVAEEVRRLADQTNEATGRIAALIGGVQTEIEDVVQSVQQSSQQVEEGYQIAGQAGERLAELNRIAEQSAELAGRISQVSGEQAREVTQMGEGVEQIAGIARQAEQAVSQGRDVAQQMRQLAEQLNQSLSRFRLPS